MGKLGRKTKPGILAGLNFTFKLYGMHVPATPINMGPHMNRGKVYSVESCERIACLPDDLGSCGWQRVTSQG